MQALIPALIKASLSFGDIPKDKVNPHFKSKYASLDAVLKAVNQSLANNGLRVVQTLEEDNRESGQTLVTTLYHESGEFISSRYQLPVCQDVQKQGSAISYARRYSVCALLNITADEDVDGGAPEQPKKNNIAGKIIKQVAELIDVDVTTIKAKIAAVGKTRSEELSHSELCSVIRLLLIDWGMAQEVFSHRKHAENSYEKLAKEADLSTPESLVDMAENFMIHVADKVQEKNQNLAATRG